MTAAAQAQDEPLIIGRYALFDVLASGGMATVHLGRLLGKEGFGRTVAVKRLHAHFTSDQEFVTMFMDEARIVARIRHPNVVPMVDVIETPGPAVLGGRETGGLFLVMEYVHGETFSRLLRACRNAQAIVPIKVLASILHGVLLGLHAAHETRGSASELIDVVHRDVSPQNIIIGADGVARVLDFGVAKAAGRAQVTREGQIKGKLAYMSPEQIRGKVDRRADVFACGVVLWEALSGKRLHEGARDVEIVTRIMQGAFAKPSEVRSDVSADLDAIVMRGLAADPDKRYQTAREMALDLERKVGLAPASEVGLWVEKFAETALRVRAERIEAMEKAAGALAPAVSVPPPPPAPPPPSGYSSAPMLPLSQPAQEVSGVTGTPIGTEVPIAPRTQKDLAPLIALVSFMVALAIIGFVLMGLSFAHRASATPAPSVSASTSTPPSPPSALPDLAPDVTPSATPESTPEPPAPAADASPPPKPAWLPAPQPKPKPSCEPFTIDSQGHRKYNLECIPKD
ncbi:MAG: serine/threonine protein kinase [Labilithrix sp.]|nr:serine/threonine protein kinase [Labilithrix sp.]MCW5809615.1 serine/threonine protein kinase [Labilithrix sp.]